MLLREVMTRNVQVLPHTASAFSAARAMRSFDIGGLPVVDETGRVEGFITDRDLAMRVIAEGRDLRATSVGDVMTPKPVRLHGSDTVDDAVRLMKEHRVRRIIVCDGDERPCGILSLGDLACHAVDAARAGDVLERISEPSRPRMDVGV